MIYKEVARVISTNEIAEGIYESCLHAPQISGETRPGQFINILPHQSWNKVMRRPMSVASQEDGEISIIYKAVGEGTRIMSQWKKGDRVDIIGPLGNCWTGFEITYPVLIGGGVGIAPIINLHHQLKKLSIDHILIMGARHKGEHFFSHEPESKRYVSTDDGSVGIKGNVVDALREIYPQNEFPEKCKIFSCGPSQMMEGVRQYALQYKIPCDLALETIMACGFGICQGCTIEKIPSAKNEHSYRNRFALACMDGSIFNAEEIVSCR